ncbi:MAG: esterase family protein [Mycobacteriaceae bacterium]|nr:esterase family protein [Mycobacteriaceae bacterium]
MKLSTFRAIAALACTVIALTAAAGVVSAAPEKPSAVTSVVKDGRIWHLKVYSAAMRKVIAVNVQRPADQSKPAPNLYMLNGLDAGEGTANWRARTTAMDWLLDKPVNVIEPIGGRGSYYTDWLKADPNLGVNKWKTFFTEELPPLLDRTLHSTGRNALTGLSTSGTSVLQLAEAKPGLWKSVAAYSGCAQIADPMGRQFVKFSTELWSGGNTVNMYGTADNPLWKANDPVINAEKLRGTLLYVSSGNGVPVPNDVQYYLGSAPGPVGVFNLGVGMAIEAATNTCTANLKQRLDALGIPATFQFKPSGTHYWPYWEQAFHESWPLLAKGMGIRP